MNFNIDGLVDEGKKLSLSLKSPPKLELRPLSDNLKHALLGDENILSIIILSSIVKKALGWTIADMKDINPIDCMYYIHLNKNAKPTMSANS